MTVPFTVLIGRSLKAVITVGESFKFTVYSNWPIFSVPTGVIRFWIDNAFTTSLAEMP